MSFLFGGGYHGGRRILDWPLGVLRLATVLGLGEFYLSPAKQIMERTWYGGEAVAGHQISRPRLVCLSGSLMSSDCYSWKEPWKNI